MKHGLYLLRHELRLLFITSSTYVAAVLFLLLMGFIYHSILREFTQRPQDLLPARLFFQLFWLPVLFLCPLLTMRSFAEERRLGTLEALLTTPVSPAAVVLAKFLASWLFYAFIWGLTLLFPWLAFHASGQAQLPDTLLEPGTLIGGYSFVLLSGTLFIAVGIFSSSLTRSQLVAGMLSFSILFILILGPRLLEQQGLTPYLPILEAPLEYIQIFDHLEDFSRGIFDTRPIAYYLTHSVLVLGISVLIVESKA